MFTEQRGIASRSVDLYVLIRRGGRVKEAGTRREGITIAFREVSKEGYAADGVLTNKEQITNLSVRTNFLPLAQQSLAILF